MGLYLLGTLPEIPKVPLSQNLMMTSIHLLVLGGSLYDVRLSRTSYSTDDDAVAEKLR